ncbi:selenocysteine synthase [Edaphobacter sp. HDX4]|uniref:selenocysteine synthase n=1 Tax=Edaphobacter sp. HDX4 TaxID=2794064 RepID=UPI002FE649D5
MASEPVSGAVTRRSFLQWSQSMVAMVGVAPLVASSTEAFAAPSEAGTATDYYAKLGVKKMINAAGTYTMYTAAVMPPQVIRAVEEAAKHPVHLHELQLRAGEYLAQKLRCEGALVSCGASSALTLATAACITSANNCKPDDIPQDVASMKNEVIVQKAHRYGYDHAIFLCGAKIVEVETLEDYKRAFNEKTVMTNFFNAAEKGEIGHEQWLEVAHQHNVPCHIDAAADMPPISNLWKYTGMGFDLVCFSGGKGIRGPQNAGLLLGKKNLIDLAHLNNNPYEGVGRGMKVAKEQIVGMVAAVDWLLEQSDESMEKEFTRRADVISKIVKDVPTLKATIFTPEVANHVPHLILTYDPAVVGITPKEVQAKLRALDPSIELNPATGSQRAGNGMPACPNALVVGTWMLLPGEPEIVGHQIRAALKKA